MLEVSWLRLCVVSLRVVVVGWYHVTSVSELLCGCGGLQLYTTSIQTTNKQQNPSINKQ
eukprot:m.263577 g.263577  ORF g.263577 m.263577 type:complete len:59 (+) comp51061_c0_seq1:46-222(+)